MDCVFTWRWRRRRRWWINAAATGIRDPDFYLLLLSLLQRPALMLAVPRRPCVPSLGTPLIPTHAQDRDVLPWSNGHADANHFRILSIHSTMLHARPTKLVWFREKY